jgi:low affinity Fe/Cu permease
MAQETMPSEARSGKGKNVFDRFADMVSHFTSKAWFFALCVLIVLLWAPSFFLFGSVDTWQLIINTLTTIVTFILMALLQNTQARSDAAIQQKLNAIAGGLADLLDDHDAAESRELQDAVGLESEESSSS